MAIPGDNSDIYFEIARGKEGFATVHKFGHTPDCTTTSTPVWSIAKPYSYLTSAKYLICASSDANDKAADNGARTVQLYGLDSNYAQQNETITLNGQAAVTTTNQYLRVFRCIVRTAGTTGYNEGYIKFIPDMAGNTFTAAGVPTTSANVLLGIEIGDNQTQMAIYTVPVSYTAYITDMWGSCSGNQEIKFSIWMRPEGEVFQNKTQAHTFRQFVQYKQKIPLEVAAKTDIEIRTVASASAADITAGFNAILVDVNQ